MRNGELGPMSELRRVAISALFGVIGGAVLWAVAPWQLAVVVGWDVAALMFVAWVVTSVGRLDAAESAAFARREDSTRAASRFIVLIGCGAALASIVFGIMKARASNGWVEFALTLAAVVAVAGTWLAVHTVFALRYAHEYFETGGGIDFNGGDPAFSDFAYLALTVGMSFAVSDTNLKTRSMRSLATVHALVSYLLGALIVGFTINILAGLLG